MNTRSVRRRKFFGSLVAAGLLASVSTPAAADIIYLSTIYDTGTGFGAEPRLLTTQETGPRRDGTESACVGVSGGATAVGASQCIGDSQVFQGNGVTNQGGDEVNPAREGNKYNTPTIGEVGWDGAEDIGLIFNATEPGGNGVTIDDVTLKFFLEDALLAAIDGTLSFDPTRAGNGVAGFLLGVDAEQQAYLNATVFSLADYAQVRLGLETTISGIHGGPESFWATNLNQTTTGGSTGGTPVPAPGVFGLFLLGLAGLVGGRALGAPSHSRSAASRGS